MGEIARLVDMPRTATVTAIEDAELLALERAAPGLARPREERVTRSLTPAEEERFLHTAPA